MKILVTGANGFLGRGIVNELCKYNNDVSAVSRHFDFLFSKNIKEYDCDIFSIDNPYEYFDKPDCLLHLAWLDGFKHDSFSHFDNLPKHKKFIESMLSSGLKKLVVMGSVHEVGFYEGSVNENTRCEPQSYYGISKNALRQACQLLCAKYGAILQWLRAFYIVHNESYGNSIFSKIVKSVEMGVSEFPFTMGLNQFDFLDYDKFCRYVVKTIMQNTINGIINICSGRPEKLSDRVERFIKENDYNIKLKYGAFSDRPYDSKAIWGDSSKLNAILKINI